MNARTAILDSALLGISVLSTLLAGALLMLGSLTPAALALGFALICAANVIF
ncbi:MAG: hypothetical protein ACRDRO_06380 [Pseudonocardiaceae bacterium]